MGASGSEARPSIPGGMYVLGEYVVDKPLEVGPLWTVYAARHVAREGERFHLCALRGMAAPRRDLIEGFARQAQLLESLCHPGIVPVVAAGVDHGLVFMITPAVEGTTLRAALDATPCALDAAEVVRIVGEVGRVLAYLHGREVQVLHRALDPSKIVLVAGDRSVRVLDVGFAHALAAVHAEVRGASVAREPSEFRAPEEDAGHVSGPAADQYALAAIARAALLRARPPAGYADGAALVAHPVLASVLGRGCAPDPAARYPSVEAFAQALAEAMESARTSPANDPARPAPPRPAPAPASRPAPPRPPLPAAKPAGLGTAGVPVEAPAPEAPAGMLPEDWPSPPSLPTAPAAPAPAEALPVEASERAPAPGADAAPVLAEGEVDTLLDSFREIVAPAVPATREPDPSPDAPTMRPSAPDGLEVSSAKIVLEVSEAIEVPSPTAPEPAPVDSPVVRLPVPQLIEPLPVRESQVPPVSASPTPAAPVVAPPPTAARASSTRATVLAVTRILGVSIVLASAVHTLGVLVERGVLRVPAPVTRVPPPAAPAASTPVARETPTPAPAPSTPVARETPAPAPAPDAGMVAAPAVGPAAPAPEAAPAPHEPASEGPLPERPSVRDRRAAERAIAARIDACEGRYGRHARLTVRYQGATGRATEVRIAGDYFTSRPIGACIEAAVRAVTLPRFRREYWDADYAFMVH